MRRRRQAGQGLSLLVLGAALSGCRCRGDTNVGDKRAYACAEVPGRDAHVEIDLGDGKRLVRDGVRAALRGVPEDAPALVTSFEGAAATGSIDLAVPDGVAVVFVVGLGALPREVLSKALAALAKRVPLVVAAPGPADEVDVVRSAIADAGKRVVDGGEVRALAVAGLEVVVVPGSDDPSAIAEHGAGCVVRVEDVLALAQRLGPRVGGKARVALVYAAPSRDPAAPRANDALAEVSAWLVAGPLDRDGAVELALPPGAPPPMLPLPRATAPRTTSTPGLVPPGFVLLKGDAGVVHLRRNG